MQPLRTAVGGTPCHVWANRSTRDRARLRLLFVPGNPGVGEYYVPFLSSLCARVPGIEITCLSHVGHAAPAAGEGVVLLEGQIEAQLRMLDSLLESDRDREGEGVPVVVVGHSIGAYMGARLGAARAVVGGTYGLFPALAHVGRAPNAARIQLLLRQRWVVTLALLLLRVLPVYAMLRGTTAAFVRRGASVHAALDLAQNEFDTVHALRDDMLRGHNTRLLWGSRDGWAPDWVRTQISHARSAVKSELDTTGLPHAFCLEHSEEVAAIVAGWLHADFLGPN